MRKYLIISFLAAASGFAALKSSAQCTLFTLANLSKTDGFSGDGGNALYANLSHTEGIAADAWGNILVADMGNNRIRRIHNTTLNISTAAGTGVAGYSGDGGPATAAMINAPFGVCTDNPGNIYFADRDNNRVRKINVSTGIITTVAGTGTAGYTGDGGPATAAEIKNPINVFIHPAVYGDLYIVGDGKIRRVSYLTGNITTFAGTSTGGFSGDGGPATAAQISADAAGMVADTAGNIYLADKGNNRIRKIAVTTGIITTVVGNGTATLSGDGGPATAAGIWHPVGLAFDMKNNLIIADNGNNRIRKVNSSTGLIETKGGGDTVTAEGAPALASFIHPEFFCTIGDCDGGKLVFTNQDQHNQVRRMMGVTTPDPPVVISGNQPFCFGNSIMLTAATGPGAWMPGSVGIIGVDASTGIVSGLAPGLAYVNYHYPAWSSCPTTIVVTVNPPVGEVISEVFEVCAGRQIFLSNTTTGGIWLASGTATIDSFTGVLTGVSPGIASVTYKVSDVCYAGTSVTVNEMPSAISGTMTAQVGAGSLLTNTLSGGAWSSSIPTVASVDATGNVSALTPGTTTIYYMMPTNCFESTIFTVTEAPPPPPPTGLSTAAFSNSVSVFPNPASDDLTIVAPVGAYQSLSVGNTLGQVLVTQQINQPQTKVDVKSLPAGMYYIMLTGTAGTRAYNFVKK